MQEKGVDFILSPVYPGPGAVIGEAEYWNYTAIWNVLDHPAVSFPSGLFVDPALDADPAYKTYKARNAIEEREWRKYSPDRYLGAPIAVQVSGPRFRDEETLAAAGFVADVLSGERSKL